MDQTQIIKQLFPKIVSNTCTPEESQQFFQAVQELNDTAPLANELENWWDGMPDPTSRDPEKELELWQRINKERKQAPVKIRRRLYQLTAAAAILICVLAATWLLNKNNQPNKSDSRHQTAAVFLPGGNKATLTLSDGSTVILDSSSQNITDANGVRIINLQQGQLSYQNQPAKTNTQEIAYNVLTTPRGGQYQVILPDGTKVWMNAESSLRYPVQFHGNNRSVTLSGEAYFETAADPAKPFFVNINNKAEVEVLGTSFNINAYTNEPNIAATLVTGKIKTTNRSGIRHPASEILLPAHQAIISANEIKVEKADMDKALAWKNGLFNFENADVQTVMKQLERWYNIDVVYEKEIPRIYFVGKMSRNMTLDGVLKTLEDSEVRFRMEGRKLVVMP